MTYVTPVQPTPRSIWGAFSEALDRGELKLPWDSNSEYTDAILRFFTELGHHWSYQVRRQYMQIDCTWHWETGTSQMIAMALEHDPSVGVGAVLEEDTPVLSHIKAPMKVLFHYPAWDQVSTHLEKIGQSIAAEELWLDEERWLVITGSDSPHSGYYLFQAFEFLNDGNWQELGIREYKVDDLRES